MSKKNMAMKRVAATTALGVGLVAGGAGIASATSGHSPRDSTTSTAATPPSPANFAGGVVTAVSSTSISVKGMDGTTNTYAIASSTTVSEGPTTVTASALAVGQHVGIQLSTDGSSATSIDIQLPALFGTVTSVSGDTVVITDPEGFSRIIVVDSSTSYSKSGATASLSDVIVGNEIIAEGTVDANGTSLDATNVVIGLPSRPSGGPGMGGPGAGGPGVGPPGASGAGPQAE
ncbi:MAG: DUF5666 domain-containing protein [Acidimicrobiales bacterium]|jgi:hypothetical protein